MGFVKLSARRELEALFGWKRREARVTASTIMKFHCGDRVREPEGRHVGRVEAVYGPTVKVKWDSGIYEWLEELDLVPVRKGEE